MFASDALKNKVIIVAEPDNTNGLQIDDALKNHGFIDIRHASSAEKIHEILKSFQDQPDSIGLIIIRENLPGCRLDKLFQEPGSTAIPYVIIRDKANQPAHGFGLSHGFGDDALFHEIIAPINRRELLLAVDFLLRLRQERLRHHGQEEQFLNQLSINSVNDAKLKFLVEHDELTGFYNRNHFMRQVGVKLNQCNKLQKEAALLFIEVDNFSFINELKGFDFSERLLVKFTIELRKLASPKSLFARYGVNEFCLFVENMNKNEARTFAELIYESIDNFKFTCEGVSHVITVLIGVATLDSGKFMRHPDEMILHARQAGNLKRRSGANGIGVYDHEDRPFQNRRRDIHWTPIIQESLARDNLFLVFQPVVQLNNGIISYYEVLLRMRHQDQIVLPNVFIPVAERVGLIHAIDLWVIDKAIDYLTALPSHKSSVSVAVNLSAKAFFYSDIIKLIHDKLELSWLNPNRLIFKITEKAVMTDFKNTVELIKRIRALGCKFVLDDFGAGFFSFNYLKSFPVDFIKIDGQFIKNLVSDETDQILVKSVVEIASKLDLITIAEFVETPETYLKLKNLGVNLAQGYAFGKPENNLLAGAALPLGDETKRMEKALHHKESYLRALIDNVPFQVWLKDTQGKFLAVNQAFSQASGYKDPDAICGKTDFDIYPPELAKEHSHDDQAIIKSRQIRTIELNRFNQPGSENWMEIFKAPVIDIQREVIGIVGFARDITERKRIEADLRIAAIAFETQEGMMITDAETTILKTNQAFSRITGYTAEEAAGVKFNDLKFGDADAASHADIWVTVYSHGSWQGEIWSKRKGGDVYAERLTITAVNAEDGAITHYVATLIDITERKAIEQRMHHIAYHDILTDLPNRILLEDRSKQAIANARRDNSNFALLYIDLDKFKPVNDTLGHDIGDLVLREVASRLAACVQRESDTVARLGGDEFVVLLSNIEKETDISAIARKILKALNQPFSINDHTINISSSIGIAIYPDHGKSVVAMMKNADTAMYQAKQAGRGCFKFYRAENH